MGGQYYVDFDTQNDGPHYENSSTEHGHWYVFYADGTAKAYAEMYLDGEDKSMWHVPKGVLEVKIRATNYSTVKAWVRNSHGEITGPGEAKQSTSSVSFPPIWQKSSTKQWVLGDTEALYICQVT